MQNVNDSTFDQAVASAPLAIVEFWNDRCPNCMRFGPIFDDVAAQMGGQIAMIKANTDENQQKAAQYGLTGVPTTVFFSNGKEVHRAVGAMSKADFLNEIAQYLAPSGPAATGIPSPASGAPPQADVVNVLVGGAVLAGVIYGLTQLL